MVSFSDAVKICLTKKFATMSGRASRAEYWWFQLFIWLTFAAICLIGTSLGDKKGNVTLFIAMGFWVITLIPNLCVCVRRLHDRGHSGAMFGWCLLGWGFGLLIINIVNMLGSDEGSNEYGPNPNAPTDSDDIFIEKENVSKVESVNIADDNTEITDVDL